MSNFRTVRARVVRYYHSNIATFLVPDEIVLPFNGLLYCNGLLMEEGVDYTIDNKLRIIRRGDPETTWPGSDKLLFATIDN